MNSFYVAKDGELGFGMSDEEVNHDLYVNLCRKDLSYDKTGEFKKRRKELQPWMPRPNMIHIAGVGCLVFNEAERTISNTKTGKSVYVNRSNINVFYYLSQVIGEEVTYEDIVVVLRPEVDKFFKNISSDFKPIRDLPYIRVISTALGFHPVAMYTLKSGVVVGISDRFVGMKRVGDEAYYAIEKESSTLTATDIAYIGMKIGILVTDDEIIDLRQDKEE